MNTQIKALAATALLALSAATHAVPVTGQGIWQTDLLARDANGNAVALSDANATYFYSQSMNVTWLGNFNVNGAQTWTTANSWAQNYSVNIGGVTVDNWRLPNIIDSGTSGCNFSYTGGTDCGYNVQTEVNGAYSEWAYLFHTILGNKAYYAPGTTTEQSGWGLTNTAYFDNMLADGYWSGTGYAPSTNNAWAFFTYDGGQDGGDVGYQLYAVAVRPGDVLREAGTVPEPGVLVLAAVAVVGLGVASRRRRAA